jgi:starvation-inducible DNA-binding protein
MEHTSSYSALQSALADLIDLALVGKQAHWNVTGSHFRSVHLELDELIATARTAADDVAERMRAVGGLPDGRAATVAKDSQIADPGAGLLDDDKVVALVTDAIAQVADRIEDSLPSLEDDLPTQDLLISIVAALNKASWMFAQQRS